MTLACSSKTEVHLQTKQIKDYFSGNTLQGEDRDSTSTASLAAFNNGQWRVEQTAGRIAAFVLAGASDDAGQLRLGGEALRNQTGFQW